MRVVSSLIALALVSTFACGKKDKSDDDDTPTNTGTGSGTGTGTDTGTDTGAKVGSVSLDLSTSSVTLPTTVGLVEALAATTKSFTPTGMKLSIMKISLFTDDSGANEQVLYKCAKATAAECLVDLQDQAALTELTTAAGKASVAVGDYKKLSLFLCADGASGSTPGIAYLKGSTTFNGVEWRTDAAAASGVDSSGTGEATETTAGTWACSTKNVLVNPAVTVAADSEIKLNVLVDNTSAAFFGTQISSGKGGCKTDGTAGSGNGVCLTYPALVPFVGEGKPTMKRFLVTHFLANSVDAATFDEAKANALVIVATDGAGKGLMAYGREFYSDTSAVPTNNNGPAIDTTYGGPTYVTETNFTTFQANADGSVAFEQGGSGDSNAGVFSAFQLTTHTGIVKTKDGATTWAYKATLLE